MDTEAIIRIEDLRTYFRTSEGVARAVDGISFEIRRGETYALVGESGCGKSVTALSILQLVPAPAGYHAGGRIALHETEISSLSLAAMRSIRGEGISMIFQEPMTALNPVFTIGNQIGEVLRLHEGLSRAQARERAIEMLEHVGIPDPAQRCDEYPHQLSGGMRQRVMIAMALACRPEMLIADEPTTALDVTIQSQILTLIRKLREEFGTAVLLITHDMAVVSENADRVGVMYAGWLVEEAPQDVLFREPAHPYTKLLLRSLPSKVEAGRALMTIQGTVPNATEFPAGCRFSTRCPYVMERCRREEPPSYAAGERHHARCFLLDPQTAEGAQVSEPEPGPAPEVSLDQDVVRLALEKVRMYFPIRRGAFKRTVGHVQAVHDVSLDIHKGETVALVGESGCGKTTVGKCIVGLLQPTAGRILVHGEPIDGLTRRALKPYRQQLQMVFQDPFSSLDPRMRIGDTIAEGMATHGVAASGAEREARVKQVMQRVGLDAEMVNRYPHEFSGGQRQRIGIARVLAVDPELVVCDEATSSLDVSVQAQILNLLKELQSELGLSYLFISHDLSVVRYISDRTAVMYLGEIVESGTTEDVLNTPIHPYTRALLSAVPRIGEDGRKRMILPGDVPSPAHPPAGCRFHPRCPFAVDACRTTLQTLEARQADESKGGPEHLAACIRKDEI